MKRLIGAVVVAGSLVVVGPAAVSRAAAVVEAKKIRVVTSDATDFSAHRSVGRHYRPYYRPYYYGRPVYYRPYPYQSPAPFTFGIGFGPFR
jgi:hypothetical protein